MAHIVLCALITTISSRRSLRWERGLKYNICDLLKLYFWSLPSLGAWIEVLSEINEMYEDRGRSLRWERGLK